MTVWTIPEDTAGTSQKPFVDRMTVLPESPGILAMRSATTAQPLTPSNVLFVMLIRPVRCAAPSFPRDRFRNRLSASLKVAPYSPGDDPPTPAYQPAFHLTNEADESE